ENSLISPVPSIFEANSGNSSPMGNKAPARKNRTPSGPLPQVCQAAAASHPNKIHRLDTFSHLISIIMEISEKNTQNPPENVIASPTFLSYLISLSGISTAEPPLSFL